MKVTVMCTHCTVEIYGVKRIAETLKKTIILVVEKPVSWFLIKGDKETALEMFEAALLDDSNFDSVFEFDKYYELEVDTHIQEDITEPKCEWTEIRLS